VCFLGACMRTCMLAYMHHSSSSRSLLSLDTTTSPYMVVVDAKKLRRRDTDTLRGYVRAGSPVVSYKRAAPAMNRPPAAIDREHTGAGAAMASVFSSAGWRQRACGSARLSWWGVSLVRAEWGCLTSSCVESGGKWRENIRGFSELEQRNATQRKVLGNPSGVMNVVRLSCMKDTSPWCDYLVLASKPPRLEAISRRRGNVHTKIHLQEKGRVKKPVATETFTPSLKTPNPHTLINRPSVFSQPNDLPFNDVTCKRRPSCLGLEDFVNRDLETPPPTGPVSLIPLLDTSPTASMLELRCESLVANISCARGILQVRVLCIKAIKKAKRG
jgi:hypothetical protein